MFASRLSSELEELNLGCKMFELKAQDILKVEFWFVNSYL